YERAAGQGGGGHRGGRRDRTSHLAGPTGVTGAPMDPDDIVIELLSDPQTQDPYPLYHSLRESAPNHPSMLGVRFVSSHAGCTELMRSHDFTTGFGLAGGGFEDRPFIQKTME